MWLYHLFSPSLRDIELILAERGVLVTRESVRRWCRKFGAELAVQWRRRRPRPGDTWQLDEVFIRMNGVQHSLACRETRALPNGAVVVRTQIVRPGKSPVELDYVMRQTAAAWKAVDVLSDGTISQVAAQRSDFRGLLASGGVAALRAGLERKVATLSSGAMA